MSPFPSADKELAELESFLAAAAEDSRAGDPAFEELRKRAERVALRIANPVRVAIVGLPAAGKSQIAGFLVGESFGEARTEAGKVLPVILRYGERAEAYASWWSGIDIPLTGTELAAAAQYNPDYVELRLPNPVLKYLSFLDMPGDAEWEDQKAQVRWVASRADILIWCAQASRGWSDDERQLWVLVPKRLQAQSLLVLTHPSPPEPGSALGPLGDNEVIGAKAQFHDVIGIATGTALAAAPLGRVEDSAAWDEAGGKALVGALLSVARIARRNDIILARDVLARLFGPPPEAEATPEPEAAPRPEPAPKPAAPAKPAEKPSPVASAPAPDDAAATAAPAEAAKPPATEQPAPPAGPPPVLAELEKGLAELIAYAQDDGAFKDWEYMSRVTELVERLTEKATLPGAMRDGADWVGRQVEEAFIALSLMQLEQGEQPCLDASTVLLQLARDLAWAEAPPEAA